MILGTSHMTLACTNIDAALAGLEDLGYRPEFVERDLPNAVQKKPFLSGDDTKHDMAFTRCADGLPLELVRYTHLGSAGRGSFTGYFAQDADQKFARLSPGSIEEAAFQVNGVTPLTHIHSLSNFATTALFGPGHENKKGLKQATLRVADLTVAQRFWCDGLGYKIVAGDNDAQWRRVTFRAPVPAWNFTIVLIAAPTSPTPATLDSVGMACLSHLCSSLPHDRERLLNAGATAASGAFDIRINGKILTVEIFRGPNSELIELMQVAAAI